MLHSCYERQVFIYLFNLLTFITIIIPILQMKKPRLSKVKAACPILSGSHLPHIGSNAQVLSTNPHFL